jgi:DNA helicase IV
VNTPAHDSAQPERGRTRAIDEEQPYITTLYNRLDLLRRRIGDRLEDLFRQRGSTHQAIWERDAFVARDVDRLARLDAVESGLCFGRLDLHDGSRQYVGRTALSDDEYEALLIDWRAPAAAPFYRATPANPGEVSRRRHIRTSRRQVIAVDDEVFDLEATPDAGSVSLSGEAALLASLESHRTGRMSDIVATIQAEQDRIIRSPLGGVLVVQGGPGTGKTVAALHRAAYLLYTHRDRLADRGVLVIGPNTTFLRYIEQVLPSLGETGVVLTTLGDMFPDVRATADDPPEVAALKGDPRMAGLLVAAVRDRQRVPSGAVDITIDDTTFTLDRQTFTDARTRARRSRRPHNLARAVFERDVLDALAHRQAEQLGEPFDDDELPAVRADLAAESAVQKVLDTYWPILTPAQLVRELFAAPTRLSAPGIAAAEQRLLERGPDAAWTLSDVPVLDEAAELLGEVPLGADAAARAAEAQRQADIRYANELLEHLELSVPVDPEVVADRYRAPSTASTTAQRAAADRSWAYGHVIVDEAQELSPMAWRMVMRRCPARSMTVVGDIAQTSSAAASRSWSDALEPEVPGRWRVEELRVNYRTPAEIMTVAADVLAEIGPDLEPPTSVRHTDVSPWFTRTDDVASTLRTVVAAEISAVGDGRVAVIVPPARLEALGGALSSPESGVVVAHEPAALDSPAVIMTVMQAKGLEFDSVIVVEPGEIVDASPHGWRDLYVAVTRATARLGVVYSTPLPPGLSDRWQGPPAG